jgi:hypothetical protein
MRVDIWHRWLNGQDAEVIALELDVPIEVVTRVVARARAERGEM